jgi:AraC-like DNA-binding protein
MVTVCTVLGPQERLRLEAAGDGWFATLHLASVRQALRAARQRRLDALVVAVHACRGEGLPAVAQFIHEFPAISTVALVSQHDSAVSETLLQLGASGVRLAVDCTAPTGWHQLRNLVAHPASPAAALIITRLHAALADATGDMRAFLESLAREAPSYTTVRRLARYLRVDRSTLIARFRRARLPSPKAYLAAMRRLHAAHLFANPGLSVGEVAHRLNYGSAQGFAKHLKLTLGLTAREFRRRFPFAVALEGYVELLITPYRETLRTFCPLNARLSDQGSNVTGVSRKG